MKNKIQTINVCGLKNYLHYCKSLTCTLFTDMKICMYCRKQLR